MRGLQPVGIDTLQQYNVNVEGVPDVIWQPIWDYQTYDAAGFTGPTLFFASPRGQAGKTIEDTNLTQGGELPAPVNMLITGIEAVFWPGRNPGVVSAAAAPAAADLALNDLYAVHNGRMSFKLTIGDQPWLDEAPLGVFPSQFYLDGFAAATAQTTAADSAVIIDSAHFAGPMYQVMPYRLISNQDFSVAVNSPALIALPSGQDARWGFRLHGYRFRLAT